MKFATVRVDGREVPAVVLECGRYVDLCAHDASLPDTVLGLVRHSDKAMSSIRGIVASPQHILGPEGVELVAPIPRPLRNVICVGKNYHEHAREFHSSGFDSTSREAIPAAPIIFTKATNSVIGSGAPIPVWRDPTKTVDYEGELGVIIGRGGSNIQAIEAYDAIFGYTIINDVTSRELQKRHQQWFLGKGIDGFCPMGPWVVSADEVGDVGQLRLQTFVNDELRQDARVADLIFDIPSLIETISGLITLEAGDIIATGTPVGVGIGYSPPRYLAAGDTVRVEISNLGVLENRAEGSQPASMTGAVRSQTA